MRNSSRKRTHPSINKRFIFLILLIFFIGVFLFLLRRGGKWDGKRRINVVINTDPILVLSLEPLTRRAVLVTIPSEMILDVPFGYGQYPSDSVVRLGELDRKKGGGLLLEKSIEKSLGIPVEGYFIHNGGQLQLGNFNATAKEEIKKDFFSYHGILFSFPVFLNRLGNAETNMSPMDTFRLWNAIRQLRPDQIEIDDLNSGPYLESELLPDGRKVKNLEKDLFDAGMADKFQDEQVRSESVSLGIVNGTDKAGIAADMARVLKNMGANVLVKTTAPKPVNDFCILYPIRNNIQDSIIVSRLISLYQCKINRSEVMYNDPVDLDVIIGEKFIK